MFLHKKNKKITCVSLNVSLETYRARKHFEYFITLSPFNVIKNAINTKIFFLFFLKKVANFRKK